MFHVNEILAVDEHFFTFWLVSVAVQTGLILTWLETLKTGFLSQLPIFQCINLHKVPWEMLEAKGVAYGL